MSAIWELPHRHVGRRVEVHERVESTNTLALERSRDPDAAGLALLAREQTAGRGQYGRSWQAPAGSSVLMSAILFPPPPLLRPALLTAWAAVSVCAIIEEAIGLSPIIKWPNDVFVNGKKVCGILIEQRGGWSTEADKETRRQGEGEKGRRGEGEIDREREMSLSPPLPFSPSPSLLSSAVVVGIGLNLLQPANFFEQAQLPLAGSLFSLSGQSLDHDAVARQLLSRLDALYSPLLAGNFAHLEETWQQRLTFLGCEVRVKLNTGRVRGRLRQIAFAGLDLETSSGEVVQLPPEMVRRVEIAE